MKDINYPSGKDDWINCEKNNSAIALNVLYAKKENIHLVYVSEQNSKRDKKIILLMISNRERWHYFAVKKYLHY